MRRPLLRAALVGLGLGLAVLLAEGAHSALAGESLLRRVLGGGAAATARRAVARDAQRLAAAGLTRGPFALARDPHVGITMKPGHRHVFLGAPCSTDAHGQRLRIGPAAPPGALRIVVLGDSVAFGMGVADDETYASVLEEMLAATAAPAAPRPVVHTVACPGWNTHNATHYLRAHLDRLAPDVVLYIPVRNDLDDTFLVDEIGQQASLVDPVAGTRLPHVNYADYLDLYVGVAQRTPLARVAAVARRGRPAAFDHVLRTGWAPESRRRWQAFGADVAALDAALAGRDARLAVVMSWDEDFQRLAARQLARACPRVPHVFLFTDRRPGDGLDGDPHPNPRCVRAGARRIAAWLIDNGWVGGAAQRPLPPQDAAYAGRAAAAPSAAASDAWLAEHLAAVRDFFTARIDLADASGFHQVYGGLAPDGSVGRALLAALAAPEATHLVLRARPAAAASGQRLEIGLRAAASAWVTLHARLPAVEDGATATLRLALPDVVRGAPCVDVLVRPSRWIAEQHEGTTRLAAFRLVALRLE